MTSCECKPILPEDCSAYYVAVKTCGVALVAQVEDTYSTIMDSQLGPNFKWLGVCPAFAVVVVKQSVTAHLWSWTGWALGQY